MEPDYSLAVHWMDAIDFEKKEKDIGNYERENNGFSIC